MKRVRCTGELHHFFDADTRSECPICGAPAGEEVAGATAPNMGYSRGKMSYINSVSRSRSQSGSSIDQSQRSSGSGFEGIEEIEPTQKLVRQQDMNKPAPVVQPAIEEKLPEDEGELIFVDLEEETPDTMPEKQPEGVFEEQYEDEPEVSVSTTEYTEHERNSQGLVSGWLVCVGGEYYGESFNIVEGQNFVGRGPSNHIALTRDSKLMDYNHFRIIYEPRKKKYYILAGDNEAAVLKVNGEILQGTCELSDFASIEVGNGKYIFVGLCSDEFNWDIYR